MERLAAILFWIGILLMADASVGLIFEDRWQRLLGKVRLRWLAFVELAVSALLLLLSFLLES